MRTTCASYVDPEMVQELIDRHNLQMLNMSQVIHGGTCPFCGQERTFALWADKGTFRCYHCGCDGRFVRTPERAAAVKAKRQAISDAAWS